MAKALTTFEAVNAHVEAAHSSLPKPSKKAAPKKGAKPASADSLLANSKLCAAYATAHPILSLIVATPFIPKKWKDVVKALMAALDILCPQK
jgi:hypothetical protein